MSKQTFFPILTTYSIKSKSTHPSTIPWELIEPFREQAMRNHNQSLEKLASRGGLCVVELYYVMHSKKWPGASHTISFEDACAWLDDTLNDKKRRIKSSRTGILSVLDFDDVPLKEFLEVANDHMKNQMWLFSSANYIIIDVHELITATLFDDEYPKKVYAELDKLLAYQWKTASHLRLKVA